MEKSKEEILSVDIDQKYRNLPYIGKVKQDKNKLDKSKLSKTK